MIFKPTTSKRNVVLAVQFGKATATGETPGTAELTRISRICGLFCDHESITEHLYNDTDEAVLLLQFWRAIRASDRIFAANVVNGLAVVRQRTWDVGVLPSAEIDLRQVYGPELLDTAQMWSRNATSSAETGAV